MAACSQQPNPGRDHREPGSAGIRRKTKDVKHSRRVWLRVTIGDGRQWVDSRLRPKLRNHQGRNGDCDHCLTRRGDGEPLGRSRDHAGNSGPHRTFTGAGPCRRQRFEAQFAAQRHRHFRRARIRRGLPAGRGPIGFGPSAVFCCWPSALSLARRCATSSSGSTTMDSCTRIRTLPPD